MSTSRYVPKTTVQPSRILSTKKSVEVTGASLPTSLRVLDNIQPPYKPMPSNNLLSLGRQGIGATTYTHIILGSGIAGAILAKKLCAAGGNVLMLERGTVDNELDGFDGVAADSDSLTTRAEHNPFYTSVVQTMPITVLADPEDDEATAILTPVLLQGNTVGGATVTNDSFYCRPSTTYLNGWEATTSDKFTTAAFQSCMEELEAFSGLSENDPERGTDGLLAVRQTNTDNTTIAAKVTAAMVTLTGGPELVDYNTANKCCSQRFQRLQSTTTGTKVTARQVMESFSDLATGTATNPSQSFTLITGVADDRILFSDTNAVAVTFKTVEGTTKFVTGEKIILCTGQNTPNVLYRSKIGRSTDTGMVITNDAIGTGIQTLAGPQMFLKTSNLNSWVTAQTPILELADFQSIAVGLTSKASASNREWMIRCYAGTRFADPTIASLLDIPTVGSVMFQGSNLIPQGSGTVTNSPAGMSVDTQLFTDSTDIENCVDMYMYMYQLYQQLQIQFPNDGWELLWPPANLFETEDRTELYHHLLRFPSITQNWVGGCKMGNEDQAVRVVGTDFKLVGTDNVYIVGSSVVPIIPDSPKCVITASLAILAAQQLLAVEE